MQIQNFEYRNSKYFNESPDNWIGQIKIQDITTNEFKNLITFIQYFIREYDNIDFNSYYPKD